MKTLSYMILALSAVAAVRAHMGEVEQHHCFDSDQTDICGRGCTAGFYGGFCNISCPEHCDELEACSQVAGKCLTGCEKNWFRYNCSENCLGHCKNETCDRKTGECTQGCLAGFYGRTCEMRCSANCSEGRCDRYGGGCRCDVGTEDKACYPQCSAYCRYGECSVDGTGRPVCSEGCVEGHTGPFCQEWCPDDCKSCSMNGTCLVRKPELLTSNGDNTKCLAWTGSQCTCCRSGWRGAKCDIDCPNCSQRYRNYTCERGCLPGYHGEICHLECPSYCSLAQSGRSLCYKSSGKCSSGCLQGYSGPHCMDQCGKNCVNNTCHFKTGNCVSCRDGYYGEDCEGTCGHCLGDRCNRDGTCKCKDGWYGPYCSNACAEQCDTDDCRVDSDGNHVCVGSCVDGFTGDDCSSPCPRDCQKCSRKTGNCLPTDLDGGESGVAIFTRVIFILAAVIVVIGVVVAWRKKWLCFAHSAQNENSRPTDEEKEQRIYMMANEDKIIGI